MTTIAWVAAALLLLLAVVAVVATRVPALDRPVRTGVAAAEVVAVLVVVVDLGTVLGADSSDRPESMFTHVGYAVASVGLLPALVWRAPTVDEAGTEARPEPVSLWVVAVALAAVATCLVRLAQTR